MNHAVHKIADRRWASVWSDVGGSVLLLVEYGERESYYSRIKPECLGELLSAFGAREFELGDRRAHLVEALTSTELGTLGIAWGSMYDGVVFDAATLERELDRLQGGYGDYARSRPNTYATTESVGAILAAFAAYLGSLHGAGNWPAIAVLINHVVDGRNTEMELAVCSQLLERLARRDHPLEPFLGYRARAHWDTFV